MWLCKIYLDLTKFGCQLNKARKTFESDVSTPNHSLVGLQFSRTVL